MRKIKIGIVTIVIFTILYGCLERIDKRDLIVFNNSQNVIYSIISPNDDMNGSHRYDSYKTDEIYKEALNKNKIIFIFRGIQPNSKVANEDAPRLWDSFFEKAESKKLRLFIVLDDSVKKYGWPMIFQKSMYSKKYELTIEDLDNCNWEVKYEGE